MRKLRRIYYPNTAKLIDSIKTMAEETEEKVYHTYSLEMFTLLLSGISSCRKVRGLHHHMGFEKLYVETKKKERKELKAYLKQYYGIVDQASLEACFAHMFSCNKEYISFLSIYKNHASLPKHAYSEEQFQVMEHCASYASMFFPIVKEQGFYAFDVNEQIGLCRIACACGIIDEEAFWAICKPLTMRVLSMFDSWHEYAISCLCGMLYFNYRFSLSDEHVQEAYELQCDLIQGLLQEGGAWSKGWYEKENKKFAIAASDIKPLLRDWSAADGCMASDRILVDGCKVGYMYRVKPEKEWDSGWRFMSGDETQEYLNEHEHVGIYKLNTICNYDMDILPFLSDECGCAYAREEDDLFHKLSKE